jgi:hypothetical protein
MSVVFAVEGVMAISAAYVGPGDVVSGAVFWLSPYFGYNAAYRGHAVELREDGGNTTQIFDIQSSGHIDMAAVSTFKGANNLFVRTLYDQTGNGNNYTQTTNANQPPFLLNQVGTQPAIVTDGVTAYSLDIASTTISQSYPMSFAWMGMQNAASSGAWQFVWCDEVGGSNQLDCFYSDGIGQGPGYTDGAVLNSSVSNNNLHAVAVSAISGANAGVINVDGTENTTTLSGSFSIAPGDGLHLFQFPTGARRLNGPTGEFGLWPVGFTGTQRTNVNNNIHSRWGF